MHYFHFTSNERIGIIALLIISSAFLCFLLCRDNKNAPYTIPELCNKKLHSSSIKRMYHPKTVNVKKEIRFSVFDPNTASQDDFEKLGLSAKQSMVIIRYRQKGGRFKTAYDFSRIYSIKPELFQKIKSFIVIDSSFLSMA